MNFAMILLLWMYTLHQNTNYIIWSRSPYETPSLHLILSIVDFPSGFVICLAPSVRISNSILFTLQLKVDRPSKGCQVDILYIHSVAKGLWTITTICIFEHSTPDVDPCLSPTVLIISAVFERLSTRFSSKELNVFSFIKIRWLWRSLKKLFKITVMFIKLVWDGFWVCDISMLEVTIRRWVNGDHEGMHTTSNNTQINCGILVMTDWY